MTHNSPFGNSQDRYTHSSASYNYSPTAPYGTSGHNAGFQAWPSGINIMRSIVLWSAVVLAVSTAIFEISQMEDSFLSLKNFPMVAYAYMFMYLTFPFIMLYFAYGITWLTSIRGHGFERKKNTWLLVVSVGYIFGRIAWMTLSGFIVMNSY